MTTSTQDLTISRPFFLSIASLMALGAAILGGLITTVLSISALSVPSEAFTTNNLPPNPQLFMALTCIVLGLITAGLVSVAVGTWRGRWWARNIAVTLNGGLLYTRLTTLIFFALNQEVLKTIAGPIPDAVDASMIITAATLASLFFAVVLPCALLWIYLRAPSQSFFTFKTPDANKRHPLSIACLTVLGILAALGLVFMFFSPIEFFVLGVQVSGTTATAVTVLRLGLTIAAVFLLNRKQMTGLKILAIPTAESALSMPIALLVHGRQHYFEILNQAARITSDAPPIGFYNETSIIVLALINTAAYLALFLWAHRALKNTPQNTHDLLENE